jgi:hypothetical protein
MRLRKGRPNGGNGRAVPSTRPNEPSMNRSIAEGSGVDSPAASALGPRATAAVRGNTGRGSGATPSPAPSRTLPIREPGTNGLQAHNSPVGPFAIVILSPDSVAVEVLNGGWPSARVADAYARTLPGIAGWRIVPTRSGGLVGPFAIVVLTPDSVAVEVLNGGWPTARLADAYALTLRGIGGCRVLPARPPSAEN